MRLGWKQREPAREDASTSGSLEDRLAAIWADVLNVSHVASDDDFFALGGNSLLAMQIAARAAETLAVRVSPIGLFEAPTLAGFANALTVADPSAALGSAVRGGGGGGGAGGPPPPPTFPPDCRRKC
jgi:hypothetical protein